MCSPGPRCRNWPGPRSPTLELPPSATPFPLASRLRPGRSPSGPAGTGSPLLLPATGSLLERRLAACPEPVTVCVPAAAPFSALRLTGTSRLLARDRVAGITACMVAVRSVGFAGAGCARIPVAEYRAASPDPLWRVAPAVLRHLEQGHMGELVGCVRAHGIAGADWVVPRGLDRYGLKLLVLTEDGAAAVRLSFPRRPGHLAARGPGLYPDRADLPLPGRDRPSP